MADLNPIQEPKEASFLGGPKGISSEKAYQQAVDENLIVILPAANQLFVDIDNNIQYLTYLSNILRLEEFYVVTGTSENPSKSGYPGRRHITVSLAEDIDDRERLILQAYLGSDLTREFLGLQRIKIQDPAPTLFLEKLPTPVPPSSDNWDDIPF